MLTVNGHATESGCYVEGHHGQYGPDHLADQLEGFGITIPRDRDPRRFRRIADWCEERGALTDAIHGVHIADRALLAAYEAQHETADTLIDLANGATTGGYWEWEDGECFLRSFHCSECGRDSADPYAAGHKHVWQHGRFTGAMTCERCHLLPLDDDDMATACPAPCDYCADADNPGAFA